MAGRGKRRNMTDRRAASKRSSRLHDGSSHDVFVSYAHADKTLAADLARELRSRGLRVWTDDTDIEDFSSISDGVVAGLQRSKALLAVYSTTYPHRPACQFELTAAYIAAQRIGDPRDRVLVVNPDADPGHIDPVELRDAKYLIPGDGVPADAIAAAVVKRVGRLKGPLGRSPSPSPPTWLPVASRIHQGRPSALPPAQERSPGRDPQGRYSRSPDPNRQGQAGRLLQARRPSRHLLVRLMQTGTNDLSEALRRL
jgi:hypothetical protein